MTDEGEGRRMSKSNSSFILPPSPFSSPRSFAAVLVLAGSLFSSGCLFARPEGPVSSSLLSCRQLSQRGMSAIDRGDWPEAETLLAQAVESCEVDSESRRYYAETLWRRGARDEARAQLEEAVRLAPEQVELHVRLAEVYLELGLTAQAGERVDQALAINPRVAGAWAIRARLLRQDGQPQQALADFHRALAYDPENRAVLWQLAELYRDLGRPQRTLANLRSLADTYPPGNEPAEVLVALAGACSALGRPKDAAEHLAAVARSGPKSPEIYWRLAEAQLQAGCPAEAAQSARAALALDPAHEGSRAVLDRLAMTARAEAVARDR